MSSPVLSRGESFTIVPRLRFSSDFRLTPSVVSRASLSRLSVSGSSQINGEIRRNSSQSSSTTVSIRRNSSRSSSISFSWRLVWHRRRWNIGLNSLTSLLKHALVNVWIKGTRKLS